MTDLAERPGTERVAESPAAEPRPEVATVADQFTALMRTFGKARARMLAATATDVEWSAHILLKCIANEGQLRASDVAGLLQSDPSTVSRQVAALVRDGLLERRSDPDDGRASLLVLTAKAGEVLAQHDRIRLEHFAHVLDGWSDADLRQFATMLCRFTEAYEAANSNWMNDRIANRSGRAGSTS